MKRSVNLGERIQAVIPATNFWA